MSFLIPVGVSYAQVLEDFRAIVRHEMAHAANGQPSLVAEAEELLDVMQAALMLGVTIQTVHEWKRKGILKYHKMGSRTYLKRSEILAALNTIQRSKK